MAVADVATESSAVGQDRLLQYRGEFPILETTTYMISHSLAPMPRGAARRLQEYSETWATRGIRAWEEGWWEMPVTCGDLVGKIIGAAPGRVVMHANVSVAQAIVCSCFSWSGERNRLVTDGLNFPSNDYIYYPLRRQGAEIVSVASEDGMTLETERMLEAIDERTQLVSVSQVAFRSSYLQDLEAIVEKAHRVGALVCADMYQSAGIVPVDVAALEVDFAVGGSVKWLLGGPGNGWLYVRPGLDAELEPQATGWAAHAEPFLFDGGQIRYAEGIRRFLNGTPNVPAMYAATTGYEMVAEIGVEAIRVKSVRQTERMIALADAAGIGVRSPRDWRVRGGVVIFDVGGRDGKAVVAELGRRGVLVDFRPGAGVRVAPHFYTTEEEVERTVGELGDVLRGISAGSVSIQPRVGES